MSVSEIKKEAREILKGKWRKAICIILAFLVISFAIGLIESLVGEENILFYIIEFAFFIISVPLSFGITISFMRLKRGESTKAFDFLKEGFSRFGKSWGVCLHTLLRMLLPIACLIVIAILMMYLNIFNVNSASINYTLVSLFNIVGIALYIATLIYVVSRGFLYVIAYNISYDNPELSSKECVKKSEALMKGNRGNFFLLSLSFIGWMILLILALYLGVAIFGVLLGLLGGILAAYAIMMLGMALLMSYMQVAFVCFYDRIIKNQETAKVE